MGELVIYLCVVAGLALGDLKQVEIGKDVMKANENAVRESASFYARETVKPDKYLRSTDVHTPVQCEARSSYETESSEKLSSVVTQPMTVTYDASKAKKDERRMYFRTRVMNFRSLLKHSQRHLSAKKTSVESNGRIPRSTKTRRLFRRKREEREDPFRSMRTMMTLWKKLTSDLVIKMEKTAKAEEKLIESLMKSDSAFPEVLVKYNSAVKAEREFLKQKVATVSAEKAEEMIDGYRTLCNATGWKYFDAFGIRKTFKEFFEKPSAGLTEYENIKRNEYASLDNFLQDISQSTANGNGKGTKTEDALIMQKTEKPSVQEAEKPIVQEAEKPSVQEAEKPSVQEAEKPSVQEAEKPSVQEAEKPIVQEAEKPSVQEAEKPSVQEVEKPSVQVAEKPSVQEAEKPSVQEAEKPSVQEVEKPRYQEAEKPRIQESDAVSIPKMDSSRIVAASYSAMKYFLTKLPSVLQNQVLLTDEAEKVVLENYAKSQTVPTEALDTYNSAKKEERQLLRRLLTEVPIILPIYKALRKGAAWNYTRLNEKFMTFFQQPSNALAQYEALKRDELASLDSFLADSSPADDQEDSKDTEAKEADKRKIRELEIVRAVNTLDQLPFF